MKTLIYSAMIACVFTSSRLSADAPTFNPQTVDDQIQIGYGLAIGDVDGDAKQDILLADKSEIVWYKNPGVPNAPWAKSIIARNLTARDNVCIAARDIDGDGMVEVAVGAQWNPGETTNTGESGALFFLKRGANPSNPWTALPITPHDPTTHRMHWLQNGGGTFGLAVLPLHGVGNKAGVGKPVRVALYSATDDSFETWKMSVLDASFHATHNCDLLSPAGNEGESLLVGGSEGIKRVTSTGESQALVLAPKSRGVGEVRMFNSDGPMSFVAIEPMHGNEVVYYVKDSENWKRVLVDGTLNAGHALATGDMLDNGSQQIVAGWRDGDSDGKVGIKLYAPDETRTKWTAHLIDDNEMACEDLKLADLDGNGKLDIIAAGRSTKNVKVYWNE